MPDGRITNVFLAGADDCNELRDAASQVFASLSRPNVHEFRVFDWRRDTNFGNFDNFQDEIFSSAETLWGSPQCDILVLLLWHKFGSDTKKEYEKYVQLFANEAAGDLVPARLMVCHYNAPVWPHDLEKSNIQGLIRWKKKVWKGWSEIATERGTVKDAGAFKDAMTKRVDEYKTEFLNN